MPWQVRKECFPVTAHVRGNNFQGIRVRVPVPSPRTDDDAGGSDQGIPASCLHSDLGNAGHNNALHPPLRRAGANCRIRSFQ